ncbi:MAG: aminoglycoside phosphotransferase family protein [Clostridia bacterium]|nr:aminoglycoside phosphotransferase family protein [Clostridia bacterium]
MTLTDTETLEMLKEVGERFRLAGEIESFGLITHGNINTTYCVSYKNPDKKYIFQKVNTYVFQDPIQIMKNIDLVTEHIRSKKSNAPALHYHHTADRNNYWFSYDGNFWRVSNNFNALTYQSTTDPKVLYQAGRGFGGFQKDLSDFDVSLLHDTIPNFHNTKKRLAGFFETVKKDPFGRVREVEREIDFIATHREIAEKLSNLFEEGALPTRVTHNDTKINNVLFNKETGEPLVVIDLDTVMPGLAAHDFGDAVRFAANTAVEDEKDLSKVSLDINLYKGFAEGFIEGTAGLLSTAEIETMALGGLTLAIELGMRFLEDYITGDRYFKTRYEGHNLVRTRCQLTLAADMERKLDMMNKIVIDTAKKFGKNGII